MMTLYFDIETEPLPEAELREICPPFDAEAVKLGNLTDPVKIRAKIEEAERSHWEDFVGGAALSPLTGRVAAIGILQSVDGKLPIESEIIDCAGSSSSSSSSSLVLDSRQDELHESREAARTRDEDEDERKEERRAEAQGLIRFWGLVEAAAELVGFNTHGFDLPFLIKRSWVLKVPVPRKLRLAKDRWWPDWNLDLYKLWQLGDARGGGKLDTIARALGLAGKTGNHGAEFGRLWRSADPAERTAAAEYLHQDVRLCQALRERLAFAFVLAAPADPADDELPMGCAANITNLEQP